MAVTGLHAEPAELRLFVWTQDSSGQEKVRIPFTTEGRVRLEALFSEHYRCGNGHGEAGDLVQCLEATDRTFPGSFSSDTRAALAKQASRTYRLLVRLMESPEARRELAIISGWGRSRILDVEVRLADSREELRPGRRLWVRDDSGEFHRVRLGEDTTLEQLADTHGTTVDAIVNTNYRSLEVWPHCQAEACTEERRGREVPVAAMRLGEHNVETRGDSFERLWTTLYHEAAHASDDAPSPEEDYRYGEDGTHRGSEIVSPAAAFAEGWAQFVPARYLPESPASRVRQVRDAEGFRTFLVESSAPDHPEGEGSAGTYREYDRSDLSPSQLLSNEYMVARVLYRVREVLPRGAAYGVAFQRTNSVQGRHVGTFLAEVYRLLSSNSGVGLLPDTRLWQEVTGRMVEVLVAETGMSAAEARRLLISGELPDGRPRGAAPFWAAEEGEVRAEAEEPGPLGREDAPATGLFGVE